MSQLMAGKDSLGDVNSQTNRTNVALHPNGSRVPMFAVISIRRRDDSGVRGPSNEVAVEYMCG